MVRGCFGFRSQKQCEEYIKQILYNDKISTVPALINGELLSEKDFIIKLFNMHPDIIDGGKLIIDVSVVLFRKMEFHKLTYAFLIMFDDGTSRVYSYKPCIHNYSESSKINYDVNRRLRNLILIDIFEYNNNNRICSMCKSNNDIQVDHIYPFSKIIADFYKKYNIDSNIMYSTTEYDSLFYEFHKSFENNLQFLCIKCNSLKSNN
jgi:5-methylcytosine-specific restriction endonuclease McrA